MLHGASTLGICRYENFCCFFWREDSTDLLYYQSKHSGDPGTDESTVESPAVITERLLSFFDFLFPPGKGEQSTARELLVVTHASAITDLVEVNNPSLQDGAARLAYFRSALPRG